MLAYTSCLLLQTGLEHTSGIRLIRLSEEHTPHLHTHTHTHTGALLIGGDVCFPCHEARFHALQPSGVGTDTGGQQSKQGPVTVGSDWIEFTFFQFMFINLFGT